MTAAEQDQTNPPYSEIPDYSDTVSAETVLKRMIDGLGFRYYWVTNGLGDSDLAYRISEDSRSSGETLEHIHTISMIIWHGVENTPNEKTHTSEWSFAQLRSETLHNLKKAADLLTQPGQPLSEREMIWINGPTKTALPIWNLINGPVADGLHHVGQIGTYRRASGNPMEAGVNVMIGKKLPPEPTN